MASTEIVWTGHSNSIDLILKSDGTGIDLSATTKVTASFGKRRIESIAPSSGVIRWGTSIGYERGEIKMFLGNSSVLPGTYDVPIVTYATVTSSDGIVWGTQRVKIIPEVEATAT